MPDFRRYLVPGGTYFFAVVSDGRAPLFREERWRAALRAAIESCRREMPFEMPAVVLLPDHLHAVWKLPDGDHDYSKRWAAIKRAFSTMFLDVGGQVRDVSNGRQRQRRRGVWQPRFWEHLIRDEDDYQTHFDYIHYNPVKHGYVTRPRDWPWSSFHRWVKEGVYPSDRGCEPGDAKRFAQIRDSVGE